jgi:hypothetical protein
MYMYLNVQSVPFICVASVPSPQRMLQTQQLSHTDTVFSLLTNTYDKI